MFIVMLLSSSLIYGIPSDLEQEVEDVENSIMLLPKEISEQQLVSTQEAFEKCLKDLEKYLDKNYDPEAEYRMLALKTDLEFLKECKEVLLGQRDLESKIAKKWMNTSYTFECYLRHFCR